MKDSKGRFTEGNTGRPAGTPNKATNKIREAFHEGMRCQGWDPNRGIAEEYYNEIFKEK